MAGIFIIIIISIESSADYFIICNCLLRVLSLIACI